MTVMEKVGLLGVTQDMVTYVIHPGNEPAHL